MSDPKDAARPKHGPLGQHLHPATSLGPQPAEPAHAWQAPHHKGGHKPVAAPPAGNLPGPGKAGGDPLPMINQSQADLQLLLGNPSDATPGDPANDLILRPQFAESYHRDRAVPNWVSWHLSLQDLGHIHRSGKFYPDASLPPGWYQAQPTDYSRTGYNRGHNCPSEHRTRTLPDNVALFVMSNMMPQAPGNDGGPWALFEGYTRDLALQGMDLFLLCGSTGSLGTLNNLGKINIPETTWYIGLVSQTPIAQPSDVTDGVRAIGLIMPNDNSIARNRWQDFIVPISKIETLTGYTFFGNLPADLQKTLKAKVDPGQ